MKLSACSALVLSMLALCGCQAVKDIIESSNRPTAKIVGVGLSNLSLEAIDLTFDVAVTNPYAVALPLVSLDYALATGGEMFVEGTASPTGSIPARGNQDVPLTVRVPFRKLFAVVTGLQPGRSIDYTADVGFAVDAPVIGELRLPLRRTGKLPIPAVPDVSVANFAVEELGLTQVKAVLNLAVTNPNDFEFDLGAMRYGLSLAGAEVATGEVSEVPKFAAGEAGSLAIPIAFSLLKLGTAAQSMLGGAAVGYGLSGEMRLDTPFGPLQVPLQSVGQAPLRR